MSDSERDEPYVHPLMIDYRDGSNRLIEMEQILPIVDRDSSGKPRSHTLASDALIIGNGPPEQVGGEDSTVTVGVEVKSIHDLLTSVNTGRLQATQLPGLLSHDVPWLLYYGQYKPGRGGRLEILGWNRRVRTWRAFEMNGREVPWIYLESQLLNLACVGVRIRKCFDEDEAAHWLAALHRWWSKPWKAHKGLRTLDTSREISLMPNMDADTLQRCKVAAQLPGVGFERAIAAAQHFPSVMSMVNADAAEWCKVPGVGKVIAGAVVRAMR